ncbi:PIG-L deacetylase family protein [Ramlibacter sp. AN1015]|uniref:PIG-L deacetylase family protein n=1 Tax=Ramlibacter sp. AN1015 TaxID=3133428 RepID=UPI0030C0D30B
MLPLNFAGDPSAHRTIVCLGAHADDIEIGCGATLLRLLADCRGVEVVWVVFSALGEREREAREGASRFLHGAARQHVRLFRFRDGHFPWQGAEIKESLEALKREFPEPDLVFTHLRGDRHQDHRTIAELTWNTWRRHMILEYEVPKYDGDLGAPNCFVPVSREVIGFKARTICDVFRSEAHKGWMTAETFEALARIRGIECAAAEGWAEAFHCRKFILQGQP